MAVRQSYTLEAVDFPHDVSSILATLTKLYMMALSWPLAAPTVTVNSLDEYLSIQTIWGTPEPPMQSGK